MNFKDLLFRGLPVAWAALFATLGFGQDDIRFGNATVNAPSAPIDTLSITPQIRLGSTVHHRKTPPNPFVRVELGTVVMNDLLAGKPGDFPRVESKLRFPGVSMNGSFPPDPDLAVGPNHIVEVVNTTIAIFDLNGKNLFQQQSDAFFAGMGAGPFQFDPKVLFDPLSQRFFILFLEEDDPKEISKLLIAVSDDANPNGKWFRYRIESKAIIGGKTMWLDYPGLAVSSDHLVVTGNMFSFDQTATGGGQFVVLPKAPLLTGASVTSTPINVGDAGTIKMSLNPEPSKVAHGIAIDSGSSLRLFGVRNDAAGKVVLDTTRINVPAFTQAPSTVTGPGGRQLDTINDRLINAATLKGRLCSAHTIADPQAASRSAVRWYDINLNNWPLGSSLPTLAQSGNIPATSGNNTLVPAVNYNRLGDLSLIYTRVGPNLNPEIVVAGRTAKDPIGSVGIQRTLASSKTTPSSGMAGRWGDYAGVVVDAQDNYSFWGVHETIGSNGDWTTEFFKWIVSTPPSILERLAPSTAILFKDPVTNVNQGSSLRGSTNDLRASDGKSIVVRSAAIDKVGQSAGVEMTFKTQFEPGVAQGLNVRLRSTFPSQAVQTILIFNWKTKTYDVATTVPGSGIPQSVTLPVDPANYVYSKGFGTFPGMPNGVVKLVVRPIRAIAAGVMPPAFVYTLDEFTLGATS